MDVDEAVRKEAAAIFASMGLSEAEAVELFYKRTIAAGKMPFAASARTEKGKKKKRMNERFAEWDAF